MEPPQSKKLDENVWKKLPIHLLEHIIAFLPIPTQTRFRVVNKHFNNWISSHGLGVLCEELPLKKYVVLWNSWQNGGFPYYSQIGGFGNLQRPSWIFNNNSLQPFVTDLSMWFIEILVAKQCFVCIRCFAKHQRSSSDPKPDMVLVILNLTNNVVREIPLEVLHFDDMNIEHVLSVKYDIAVHENNDRDFRFITVITTLFNDVAAMKVYDSMTNRYMKFDNIFPRLEYGREIYTGPGGATFDRMFFLNTKKRTGITRLTSFTYYNNLLVMDAGVDDVNRTEIDIELPRCVMKGSFAEIELITTSSNRVFVLGLSNTALSLWEVDLTTKEFVECNEFRIVGEDSFLLRFVGAYSNLFVFGPQMTDCIDPLIVRRNNMLDRMEDVNCVMDGMEAILDRVEKMLRDCRNNLSPLRPLGYYTMEKFQNSRGFGTLGIDSGDTQHKLQSVGEFRVYDLMRREWRDLTRIEVKSMSKSSSDFNGLHFEYFYDPCVEFSDS